MTAKPFVANWLIGVTLKFRDAVSEICRGFSEPLANQYALRVESGAFDFSATIRRFWIVARKGAWHLECLVAQRPTSPVVQPTSKNKKGTA